MGLVELKGFKLQVSLHACQHPCVYFAISLSAKTVCCNARACAHFVREPGTSSLHAEFFLLNV